MGCCSPNFRKVVEEQEKKLNENRSDELPRWIKWLSAVISISLIATALYISL